MYNFCLKALSVFYILAGLNHFIHPDFYLKITPSYMPHPLALVYISGVAEILLGIMVLFTRYRKAACLFII
jgi:uncharacterized membrane protein